MANEQTSVPLYAASEVLTAANMNISAGTGVPVFATTVTRDAAFGGASEKVLAEGQLCYLSSTNVVQYYDGAAWATVGPAAASAVAQVKSASITASSSISSVGVFVDIGLSIAITPTSASNKILVTGQVSLSCASNGAFAYLIMRDATAVGIGDASGSRKRATGSGSADPADAPARTLALNFLDSPATTSAITYKIQATDLFASSLIYVNRGENNTNTSNYPTAISTITVMEVTP